MRTPFSEVLDSLYLASLHLIQSNDLPDYLQLFHSRLGNPFHAWVAACRFDHDENFSPGPHNVALRELHKLLAPFNVVATSSAQSDHQAGIVYLERCLSNTAALVAWHGLTPDGETAVRDVLWTLFPKARNAPPAKFVRLFKSYKPDVLIPDLRVAIEYKYIDAPERLKTVIEEIAVDVKGYTDDPAYDTFYAVFYLTGHFCTGERFREAWSEWAFPTNWKPIFVVGS